MWSQPRARAREVAFSLSRNSADDGEPYQLGPLRDDQSNAASGGMQQQDVAWLELMDAAQEIRSREATHRHRGGRFERNLVWKLDQRRGRDQPLGAVGT
jgi:hypothetical protein